MCPFKKKTRSQMKIILPCSKPQQPNRGRVLLPHHPHAHILIIWKRIQRNIQSNPTLPSPLEHPAGVGMFARSLAPSLQPSSGSSAGAAHTRPSLSPGGHPPLPVWGVWGLFGSRRRCLPHCPHQTQGWGSWPSPGVRRLNW